MSPAEALPCHHVIDAECFEAYPEQARRLFAIKLLFTLFPGEITRRLMKLLGIDLVELLTQLGIPTEDLQGIEDAAARAQAAADAAQAALEQAQAEWDRALREWRLAQEAADQAQRDADAAAAQDQAAAQDAADQAQAAADQAKAAADRAFAAATAAIAAATETAAEAEAAAQAAAEAEAAATATSPLAKEAQETGVVGPLGTMPWEPGPPGAPESSPIAGITRFYSTVHDGYIHRTGTTWQEAHDAESGYFKYTGYLCSASAIMSLNFEPAYGMIRRVFFTFNLSGIPTSKTVDSAELRCYCPDSPNLDVIVQSSAHNDPLELTDFDAFYETVLAQDTWVAGENSLTFGEAGITYLQARLGGLAKLCLREYVNDYSNVDGGPSTSRAGGVCFSEATDLAQRPYLEINYS